MKLLLLLCVCVCRNGAACVGAVVPGLPAGGQLGAAHALRHRARPLHRQVAGRSVGRPHPRRVQARYTRPCQPPPPRLSSAPPPLQCPLQHLSLSPRLMQLACPWQMWQPRSSLALTLICPQAPRPFLLQCRQCPQRWALPWCSRVLLLAARSPLALRSPLGVRHAPSRLGVPPLLLAPWGLCPRERTVFYLRCPWWASRAAQPSLASWVQV